MQSLILSFIVSLITTFFVIRFEHVHSRFSADHDLSGVQKFHAVPVPRIGGVGLMLALATCVPLLWGKGAPELQGYGYMLLASLPAFFGGFAEDITKRVGALQRLLMTMLAAGVGVFLLDAKLDHLGVPWLDDALAIAPVAILFTMIAVGGIANAINIVDGYNGLAGVMSVLIFLSLAYVSFLVRDMLLWTVSIASVGALLGFLLWNFPRGLIFLGDGGAYLIGFLIGEISVLLVMRNPTVSPWFPFLLVIYPIFETLFSIYRKKFIRGMSPGVPDGVHLHMLVYKRLVRWAVGSKLPHHRIQRNAMTAPYLWVLCSLGVFPAVLFWNNTPVLLGFVALFVLSYTWLYRNIVRFKSPRWMVLRYHHRLVHPDTAKYRQLQK